MILNAGVQTPKLERHPQTGHPTTFQVNYLSTMLLAQLLVPIMRDKARHGEPGRLSVVASDMPYSHKLKAVGPVIPQCDKETGWDEYVAYSNSKLALVASVATLAEQVSADEVVINTVNPGLCAGTDLKKKTGEPLFDGLFVPAFIRLLGRSIEIGASTYINGAVVQGRESHGSYTSDWTIKP